MFEAELALAHEIADRAAAIATALFQRDFDVRIKADNTPVSEADLRIEAMAREAIGSRFPGDAILGEEGGSSGSAERVWIIDPIDGTKNFIAGIQIWATLIALRVDGQHLVAVVSAPALGERYGAVRGCGATLNNEPIHVSSVADVGSAMLLYSQLGSILKSPLRASFLELASRAGRTRDVGDFWAHMLVARGSADVMLEPSLRVWDMAAPQLIVEEAGGRVTSFSGQPFEDGGSTLTTNGVLHDEIIRSLRPAARLADG